MEKKDLYKSLKSIVIGIQFRKNFSIEDNLGKITDEILYSKKSYFNTDFFPKYQPSVNETILVNSDTRNNLIINSSNIVFEYNINETDIEEIYTKFYEHIIKNIMIKHNITDINRIGFVKRYLITNNDLSKSFINKTIGKTIAGVNDINLRFSKKITTLKAVENQKTFDYDNVLYSIIKKNDEPDLNLILDYQRYFVPLLENAEQIKFDNVKRVADEYNNNTFLNWINENYEVNNVKTKK